MSTDSETTRELVEWTKAGPKTWHAHIDGAAPVTELRASGRKPRQTHKTFASEEEARGALEKAAREKMVAGFVSMRDPAGAANGDLLFAMRTPGGASCDDFDVDPEARRAFVASGRGDKKAWVVWADLSNGRLDARDVAPDSPGGQLFIHAALVNADASLGYYALNPRLREQDAATGTERVIADAYGSATNPFCVKPGTDAAHERLLVLSARDVLEVREIRSGITLCEISMRSGSLECRAAAISPSGSRVAAYVASRNVIYGQGNERRGGTSEVRVFTVKDGELVARIKMPDQVSKLDVTPDDTAVMVSLDYPGGPCEYAIDTGERRFALLSDDGSLASSTGWAFSPDGEMLAIADRTRAEVRLLDARSKEERATFASLPYSHVHRLAFAAGGTRLFVGGGGLLSMYAIART